MFAGLEQMDFVDLGTVSSITTKKDQSEVSKRDVTLVDQSLYSIRCTLWGKSAETFETGMHAVV